MFRSLFSAICLLLLIGGADAAEEVAPSYGPELQGFVYPFPVQNFGFHTQNQTVNMAYLDVAPATPNGRAVVLLHGKKVCAATWGDTIIVLAAAGYRVIAPDQIGSFPLVQCVSNGRCVD